MKKIVLILYVASSALLTAYSAGWSQTRFVETSAAILQDRNSETVYGTEQPLLLASTATPTQSMSVATQAVRRPVLAKAAAVRAAVKKKATQLIRGIASFYSSALHGRTTASGEQYDENALTAAHLSYPHGTKVRVRNPRNGKTVVVRINDRGPHMKGRIIDLSARAAKELRMYGQGVGVVELEVLKP